MVTWSCCSPYKERCGRKEDEVSPFLLFGDFKARDSHFPSGQHPSPAMGWKVICEFLSSSLTFSFCLLKDKGNGRHCFTCLPDIVLPTGMSHFALPLIFCFACVTAWDSTWVDIQVLSLLLLLCISQRVADFYPLPNLVFVSKGFCSGREAE